MSIINVPYKENNIFLGEGLKFDEGGPEKQVIYLVWPKSPQSIKQTK